MTLIDSFNLALDKFVKRESKKHGVQGIFVTGSLVSGQVNKHSDMDVFILHSEDFSQVKAKYVDGIEFECAYKSHAHFLKDLERQDPKDITRLAHAKILFDPQHKLEEILLLAKKIYARGPKKKVTIRETYRLTDFFNDIEDNLSNPAMLCTMVQAFQLLLHIVYTKNNLWGVSEKNLLPYLEKHDSHMAKLAKDFLKEQPLKTRWFVLQKMRAYVMQGVPPLPRMWKTKRHA